MYSTLHGHAGWSRVAHGLLTKVSHGDDHYLAEAHDEIQPRIDIINMAGKVVGTVDSDLFVIHL
jgi:hypothetical protein